MKRKGKNKWILNLITFIIIGLSNTNSYSQIQIEIEQNYNLGNHKLRFYNVDYANMYIECCGDLIFVPKIADNLFEISSNNQNKLLLSCICDNTAIRIENENYCFVLENVSLDYLLLHTGKRMTLNLYRSKYSNIDNYQITNHTEVKSVGLLRIEKNVKEKQSLVGNLPKGLVT